MWIPAQLSLVRIIKRVFIQLLLNCQLEVRERGEGLSFKLILFKGQTYTPFGTSGLAVASALCQLTSAQLALLQPPNTEKRPKRKSNLKRFMPFMS